MTSDADAPLTGNTAFVRFCIAGAGTSFGFQMMSIAVGWQIYAITGRALDLGFVGLVQFIPSLLLALPAGHVADRRERRRIVVAAQGTVCFALCLLAGLAGFFALSALGILAILFVVGCAMAFEFPAERSMLPALVTPLQLPRAMAVSSSVSQAATIAGPALGGLLYIAGPSVVYATSATLFLISASLIATLPSVRVPPPTEPTTLETVFAGVHFIRGKPDILGVISLDLFAVLFGGATALLPVFAHDVLHTGPTGLGLLRAAPAVGALAMSLWIARYGMRRRVGLVMFGAVGAFGLATIVFALSTALWLSLLALLLLGAFDMVSVVIRSALVQLDTPDAMRGRVNGVNAIFINTSNQLGEFESGTLAALVGAVPATLIGGIGTLVVVAAWMSIFPGLRRRQRLDRSGS